MKGLSSKNTMRNTFDSPFNCFNFRSGNSKQSFISSSNQSTKYKMTGTNVTRQHTRSNSKVEMIDNLAHNTTDEENQIARSKRGEIVE